MLEINGYENAKEVFHFFEEISRIPRGSGNTKHIADFLVRFAKERRLEYVRDASDNVIIKKAATPGYESRGAVMIQGHTDIVAEKTPEKKIDMEKEGLAIFVDGDYIRADGTTLGADDGIAVAYALALLDSEGIPHPALECIFTSDEEIGLLGASALDASVLSSRTMINIDSDMEGIFTVGCAGGIRLDITKNDLKKQALVCKNGYKIEVSGLYGGHSGMEIDKGRINANKLICELLYEFEDIQLASVFGGNADNAIPRDAYAYIAANDGFEKKFDAVKLKYLERINKETGSNITLTRVELDDAYSREDTLKILSLINELPNGVMTMSEDIEGLVETSLNLGILKIADGVNITFSIRSSKNKQKNNLRDKLICIANKYGCEASAHGEYPAWEYTKGTHLESVLVDTYRDMYAKEPRVMTIHAGLECGIFAEKIPGLECVSLGPNNLDIHTPNERLSISSSVRVWEFLLNLLKKI